jgi:hypothetical protein
MEFTKMTRGNYSITHEIHLGERRLLDVAGVEAALAKSQYPIKQPGIRRMIRMGQLPFHKANGKYWLDAQEVLTILLKPFVEIDELAGV